MIEGKKMKKFRFGSGATFALAVALLIGCGGGGGGGTSATGGSGGATGLAEALATLRSGMRSGNPTLAELQALQTQFRAAVTAEPTNVDARTGAAIVSAAVASRKILDVYGSNVDLNDLPNLNFPLVDAAVSLRLPAIADGSFAPKNAPFPTTLIPRLVPMIGLPTLSSYSDPKIWDLAREASSAQADLDAAIADLLAIADAAPATSVGDPTPDGSETTTNAVANFASIERRALLTQLRAMRISTGVLDAYNYNLGTFNQAAGALDTYATQFTNASPIEPTTYAPASPFLTLKSGGATSLAAVKTLFSDVRTVGRSFADGMQARPTGGDFTISRDDYSTGLLDDLRSALDAFKAFADGPVSIDGFPYVATPSDDTIPVRVDLNVLFTNPPSDFKAYLPTLDPAEIAPGSGLVGMVVTPPLDRTFGGIFPDGLDSNGYFDRFDLVDPTWTNASLLTFALRLLL